MERPDPNRGAASEPIQDFGLQPVGTGQLAAGRTGGTGSHLPTIGTQAHLITGLATFTGRAWGAGQSLQGRRQ